MRKRSNLPPLTIRNRFTLKSNVDRILAPHVRALGINGPILGGGDLGVVYRSRIQGRVHKVTVDHVEAEIAQQVMMRKLPTHYLPEVYAVWSVPWLAKKLTNWPATGCWIIEREDVDDVSLPRPEQERVIAFNAPLRETFAPVGDEIRGLVTSLGSMLSHSNNPRTQLENVRHLLWSAGVDEQLKGLVDEVINLRMRYSMYDVSTFADMLYVWEIMARYGYFYYDVTMLNYGRRRDRSIVRRDMGSAMNLHAYTIDAIPELPPLKPSH